MRWIALLLALWLAPIGLANEPIDDDDAATVHAVERGGCPGGVCGPRRPRPKR